ncbi:MAG: GerMN domain-containing protein [Actinophytocola sp.]|uniref:GerMN domain-containing protein n=1 Tax=Actinophytocola sp. TaxID=1872138 RepID=UPI003D6AFB54
MTRRHLLARVVLIAVLGVVLTAGCGVRPTGVITGGPAPTGHAFGRPAAPPGRGEGAALYLLADSALTPVLRPTRRPVSLTQTLELLQDGPNVDERAANLTSEVPAGLDPVTVTTDASGDVTVLVSADVRTLSTAAVDQIVCTVRDALSTTAPITLTSDAATRGPRTCPLTG